MIRLHASAGKVLGLEAIDDAVIPQCIERVKLRLPKCDLTKYRRKPAQARLETEAKEAICGVFADHYPNAKFLISRTWPWAQVTLKGSRATVEIWVGQDYADDEDGIEPFDVTVKRANLDFSEQVAEIVSRAKAKTKPALELTEIAPAPKKASRMKSMVQQRERK